MPNLEKIIRDGGQRGKNDLTPAIAELTRTLADISGLGLRPVLNVKDSQFGARGNGIDVDRVAIQKALDAAQSGDVVYVPRGTYPIDSTLTITTSGVTLLLHREAKLVAVSSATARINVGNSGAEVSNVAILGGVLDWSGGSSSSYGISAFISSGFYLADMRILNAQQNVGVSISGDGTNPTRFLLARVEVEDSGQDGIVTAASASVGLIDRCLVKNAGVSNPGSTSQGIYTQGVDTVVRDSRVDGCEDNGIRLQGARDEARGCYVTGWQGADGIRLMADNTRALDCVAENDDSAGTANAFRITDRAASTTTGCSVIGCIGRGANNGLRIDSAGQGNLGGHRVVGNLFEANTNDGIHADAGPRTVLQGNICRNNGRDGIHGTDVNYYICVANQCYDSQGTKTQQYGIRTTGTADLWQVIANNAFASDHTTGGILLANSANDVVIAGKLRSPLNANNFLLLDDGSGNAVLGSRGSLTLGIDEDNNASATELSVRRNGSQSIFKVLEALGLTLPQGGGLSATATAAKNLRGSATFASAGTVTVTFGTAESDTNYFVAISGDANEAFWVTGKGTGGFTINSSNASSTATVDWILVR